MNPLAALVLATPIFGLSLQAPTVAPLPAMPAAHVANAMPSATEFALSGSTLHFQTTDSAASAAAAEEEAYDNALRERNRIASIHRVLGVSTWASMTVSLVLGGIQYHNLYGTFGSLEDTPCVRGTAIFGQGTCTGTPWPHALTAGLTTGLYFSTFTLSLFMPDPDNAAEGDNAFARTLRMHKILRWIHFGGMLAQIILGPIIANAGNRATDFGTLQTLATIHMGLGLVTYGALTWAGALMTF